MLVVDLIIDARWVLPMEPAQAVLSDYSLVVDRGRIVALAPTSRVRQNYQGRTHVVRDQHVLLPGFVNAHAHAAMGLLPAAPLRSPVQQWLREQVWPLEKRWVSAEFVRTGSQLAMLDMLRHGITCCADMYLFPEEVARIAHEWRLRVAVGLPIADGASPWARTADEYLERAGSLYDQWSDDPWVTPYFAPHAPYSVSNATLERLRKAADQLDAPIAMHVHETQDEVAASLREYSRRPLVRLQDLGLLRPGFAAVHAVALEDPDIDLLARAGCGVVHCPSSNMRLASGIAPVARLQAAGVTVALGSDGPLSGTRPDILSEARLASLLASGQGQSLNALDSVAALHAATLGGAQVLGLAERIGSLAAGKDADCICVALDVELQSQANLFDTLLYQANAGRDVSDVWVAGRARRLDSQWQDLDPAPVQAAARQWQSRMATRSAA